MATLFSGGYDNYELGRMPPERMIWCRNPLPCRERIWTADPVAGGYGRQTIPFALAPSATTTVTSGGPSGEASWVTVHVGCPATYTEPATGHTRFCEGKYGHSGFHWVNRDSIRWLWGPLTL